MKRVIAYISVLIVLMGCRSLTSPRMCFKKGDTIGLIQVDIYNNGLKSRSCNYITSPNAFCAEGKPSYDSMKCDEFNR